jgi:hypothetical protein
MEDSPGTASYSLKLPHEPGVLMTVTCRAAGCSSMVGGIRARDAVIPQRGHPTMGQRHVHEGVGGVGQAGQVTSRGPPVKYSAVDRPSRPCRKDVPWVA